MPFVPDQLANPRQPVAEPVVSVDIDEESLAAVGQWPWPRIEVARMVDRLRLAGATAIAFDVVFPEQDSTSPGVHADSLSHVEAGVVEAARALTNNDTVHDQARSEGRSGGTGCVRT